MYLTLLTGGLASGKGTARALVERLGAATFDLDSLAKQEQETPAVLSALQEAFGEDILSADGILDRPLLAQRAFASQEATEKLNALCWPPVAARLEQLLGALAASPTTGLVLVEIPLLVESGALLDRADEVLTIAADEGLRLERALARGMDATDAKRRLAKQASDEQRAAISNTILTNNGSLANLKAQVSDWYARRHREGKF